MAPSYGNAITPLTAERPAGQKMVYRPSRCRQEHFGACCGGRTSLGKFGHGICSDLGFSIEDRCENIRRIAEAANLVAEAGVIAVTTFISPLRTDRERHCNPLSHEDFIETYCMAPPEVCEAWDVKGLYSRAHAGEVNELTGVSSPYEAPLNPALTVNTGGQPRQAYVAQVLPYLRQRKSFTQSA